MTTAFDSESLEFVLKDLSVETLKIPSGEINNAPFLLEHARSGRDIIMSTGMSNENEIIDALGVIAFGFLNNSNPSKEAFLESYESEKGKDHLKNKLSLLHCTSEYPTPLRNVNLRAMQRIMEKFDLRTGYSDHSEEIITAIVAVTIGATIIEKHLTINKSFEGPDHNTSFDPVEFKKMVQAIRNVELVLGSEHKTPTQMEKKNKLVSRKSIVAKIKIKKGDIFSIENITAKRPGDGIDPMFFWELIGTSSQNSYNPDDQIHE